MHGEYCSNCGQVAKGIDRVFLTLVNEAFEDVFRRNSRIWKTFIYLLFRPGLLSQEYCIGRRVSYIRPVKLYFFTSILFFVSLSVINFYTEVSTFSQNDSAQISEQDSDAVQPPVTIELDLGNNEAEEPPRLTDGDQEDLDEVIDSLTLENNSNLAKLIGEKIKKIEQDPSQIEPVILEFAPPVIFCLLPLFALLLKLSYLTKRIYYTEHLILALHNHSFLFFISTINLVLSLALQKLFGITDVVGAIVFLWTPVYMWLSMKNVYQQGKFITTTKFIILSLVYLALLLLGVVLCFIFGVMTL